MIIKNIDYLCKTLKNFLIFKYINKYNMDTMFCGQSDWRYLYCIVMNYPENPSNNDKYKYKPFIIKKCDSELNKCTSSDVFNSDHYILPNEYPVYQFGNTYNLTYKERNKLIDNILNDKPLNYEEELIKLNYTTNDPLDVSQQINNKRYAKIIYEDL